MMPKCLAGCAAVAMLVSIDCATAREPAPARAAAVRSLSVHAAPIRGAAADYDAVLELVADNRFVLLGEATHGTAEFYRERARLTRRLIEEKGFTVVAIEADWPDAYDVNQFIHGSGPATAREALATFDRFPEWMWRNEEFRALVEWLREYNASPKGRAGPVGLYGIDLYSVPEAAREVVAFLETDDPSAAQRAAERYRCLERYRFETMPEYGRDVTTGARKSCAEAAIAELTELTARVTRDGEGHRPGDDELISAWQSARVVANGEAYYRTMHAGGVASWNLRDRHMADTIDALSRHLNEGAPKPARLVVWAHNSHLGDARVTERSAIGESNVGQLMRQRHDGDAVLVGFTTYAGRVRAASNWGGSGRDQALRPAIPESFSALFHETGEPAFALRLRGNAGVAEALGGRRLERFVGVVYVPATERRSHYFETDLAKQFDVVVHIDVTTAVRPIPRSPGK